jgi:hypothetical protein
MGADRPVVEPTDVAERIMGLVGRAALDDRTNRGGHLFRHDVRYGAGAPPSDEFAFHDSLRFGALFQTAGVTLEELRRDGREGVDLAPLRFGTFPRLLGLGVHAFLYQFEPASRLVPGLIEGHRAVVAERAASRVFRVAGISGDQHKAFVALVGHPQR